MTQKEIARQCGVSVATVSRVIRNKDHKCASQQTKDKIWELVRQSGYVPNEAAQRLKQPAAPRVQLPSRTVSFLHAKIPTDFADRIFSAIARAAEEAAVSESFRLGYNFSALDHTPEQTQEFLLTHRSDGLVVFGRLDDRLYSALRKSAKNVIVVGLSDFRPPFDQVFADGYVAAKKALGYLYGLGHRAIGYIGDTGTEVRYAAYTDFMKEKGLPVPPGYIRRCSMSMQKGFEQVSRLLREADPLPTALFCDKDITAIGAMKGIREQHLYVPDDISVISVDDMEASQFILPPLTSVCIPKQELGRLAVKILSDRMNRGHTLPMRTELPCDLIIRESCAAPRRE